MHNRLKQRIAIQSLNKYHLLRTRKVSWDIFSTRLDGNDTKRIRKNALIHLSAEIEYKYVAVDACFLFETLLFYFF